MFAYYLQGLTAKEIASQLNSEEIKNIYGAHFKHFSITKMLGNERYIGTLLLQKTYVIDHISKKRKINNGELPKYLIEDAHPAIISKEIFQAVQDERMRRRNLGAVASKNKGKNTKGEKPCLMNKKKT